jgi:superfamily II DNA or RNA helicase
MLTTIETGTFADLNLLPSYNSERGTNRDILTAFYIPVLERAVEFNCVTGYFRSSFIASAAAGVSRFIYNGGSMKLLINAEVQERDVDALTGEIDVDGSFAERLREELVPKDEVSAQRLAVLAWLYNEGRLDVKVAIPYERDRPLVSANGAQVPLQHAKYGYFVDADNRRIAFNGSANVSQTALEFNNEDIDVYGESAPIHLENRIAQFDDKWAGNMSGFRVMPLPTAVRDELLTFAGPEPPPRMDPLEPQPDANEPTEIGQVAARATIVRYAPGFPNSAGLAEATSGVILQPHQRQVSFRLADQYPRSWIVADEVGLGKTISAGISLRRLLLSGHVKRVLILAPANLRQNWQNELFEKFGLWVPRLSDGTVISPNPTQQPRKLASNENPFATEAVLIASSHLARRAKQTEQIMEAARQQPFDLIIVDEAHHARYSGVMNAKKQEPNRLLRLLQKIQEQRAARALWLLTATPLQTSVSDLHALLKVVGIEKPFDDIARFERYYTQIVSPKPSWLSVQRTGDNYRKGRSLDPDEAAFLKRIEKTVVASNRERILAFTGSTKSVAETVEHRDFDKAATIALRQWLRLRGPVERHITRHTRETLREYQRRGLITEPLATRDVTSPAIKFTSAEFDLLARLDLYISRLMRTFESNHRAKFVLEIYQQRLTSSWAAIERSLQSRLDRTPLDLAETDDEDDDDDDTIDHTSIVPLTPSESSEISAYIHELREVQNVDSKLTKLEACISEARASGRRIIIFTQYVDTLNYLLARIKPTYENVLATYTGDGGRIFKDGREQKVGKSELVQAVRSQRVQIVLATDAAAEGLNLQTCSYLVNYDMPWNPMRVEQRIGRIDRLGQAEPAIIVKNFFVSDAERDRYRALANRIKDFNTYIGGLPPILGVVEEGFINRPYIEQQSSLEDQLPVPERGPTPLRHDEFVEVVRDEIHALATTGNVAWDLAAASADPENWAAAATYGHPSLSADLAKITPPEVLTVATNEFGIAVVARSDGKEPTIISSIGEVRELGDIVDAQRAKAVAAEALRIAEVNRREALKVDAFQNVPDMRLASIRADLVELLRASVRLTMSHASTTRGVVLRASEAYELMSQTEGPLGSPIFLAMTLAANLGIPESEFFGHQPLTHVTTSAYHAERQKLETTAGDIIIRYKALGA